MPTRRCLNSPIALLALLVLATGLAYWPGMGGAFIFDDYATLSRLGKYGQIDSLDQVVLFVAGDFTGTAGRPLSLLSFLLNGTAWPTEPWPFKITNLALHLCIGGLLYVFMRQLLRYCNVSARQAGWGAVFATGVWLLNPFNISTVLYVVQRMAMLSALFMLVGLIAYLHGRSRMVSDARTGYAWMTAALVVFTPLAVFSKENGALLPVLILVLEYSLLRFGPAARAGICTVPSRVWTLVFLWLPSLMLLFVLLYIGTPASYASREFTLYERLLTESRVLFDYLWHWFNPFAVPTGVLADGYVISKGWLEPWSTLPAVAGILGLIAWSVWQRRKYPLVAAVILFFFAGHLMESSVLALEVYFEHRNYLPGMLLAMPIAYAAVQHSGRRQAGVILMVMFLLAMAFQTQRLATIWGNELTLAKWATLANPASSRAMDNLAAVLSTRGRSDLAVSVLEDGIHRFPENSHFQLHMLWEKCVAGYIPEADWDRANTQFKQHPLKIRSVPLLTALVSMLPSTQCKGLEVERLLPLVEWQADHPPAQSDAEMLWRLRHLQGELLVKVGKPEAALVAFGESMKLRPNLGVGLNQVAMLASGRYFTEGLKWLDQVEKIQPPSGLGMKTVHSYYAGGIARLRKNMQDDLEKQNTAMTGPNNLPSVDTER